MKLFPAQVFFYLVGVREKHLEEVKTFAQKARVPGYFACYVAWKHVSRSWTSTEGSRKARHPGYFWEGHEVAMLAAN